MQYYIKNRDTIPGIDISSTDNGGTLLDIDKEVLKNAGNYEIKNKKIVLLDEGKRFDDSIEKHNAPILEKLKQLDLELSRPLGTLMDTLLDIIELVDGDPVLLLSEVKRIMELFPDDMLKIRSVVKQKKEFRSELK